MTVNPPHSAGIEKDGGMRPFRFLATIGDNDGYSDLIPFARKAEAMGCSGFVIPDHLMGLAPLLPLAQVAAVTERLRVGTFVLNNSLRHPAVLAQELATLDRLSDGRLDIGIGAGWNKPEYDAIGIPFEPVGVRIKKLAEAIAIIKGSFGDGAFSFDGEYYTITDLDDIPTPVQQPHPPFFLGGGGKRLLTLAARQAQVIGLAPRILAGDVPRLDAPSITAAATEEKIGWIREAAGERFAEIELNTYPTGGPTVITSEPRAEAQRRADRIREKTGVELTVEEILESPHTYIGSAKELTAKFLELRERFGISSFLIDDLDALAPVVEALAGQ
ncbi:putative F420-dependent oxidoreductase [Catenulispora sp. GP43]